MDKQAEKDNQPTQQAIDMHKVGAEDAKRAKTLADQRKLKPAQVIKLVEEFATLGDAYHTATRYGLTVPELRRLFDSLGIGDVNDARKALRTGLLSNVADNAEAQRQEAESVAKAEDAERAKRFEASQAETVTDLVVDSESVGERAARLNKETKARYAKQQADKAAKASENKDRFTIPESLVGSFRKTVMYGIQATQRQFGGSRAEILAEVKRLMPQVDVDMIGS